MYRPRPFKIEYLKRIQRVGKIVSCSTPDGVVRSAAFRLLATDQTCALIYFEDDPFGRLVKDEKGAIHLEIF